MYVRTCLVSDRCLKKTFEKRRTAGMYSNTSIISTVEEGGEGRGWRENGRERKGVNRGGVK